MPSDTKVKCGACGEITLKSKWKDVETEETPFAGGCPHCAGEFYDEVE